MDIPFPRLDLANLPTPLEPLPRLGAALGVPDLWVKRDDATGLGLGGNKARKLEYLLADALQRGCDTVLTVGGVQSNHARMTAAAACKLGLRCELLLTDPVPAEPPQGNLLLDRIFGARVHFLPPGGDGPSPEAWLENRGAELQSQGDRPCIIPVGGSTPLGALGYVRAVQELAAQVAGWERAPDRIVVAAGSMGTLAGILVGVRQWLPRVRVHGISVSAERSVGEARCAALLLGLRELVGQIGAVADVGDCRIHDDWVGAGYAIPTEAGNRALALAARLEGLLLDPVYTAKAMSGLAGLREQGAIGPAERVIFWHTGGAPALFALAPNLPDVP